LRILAEQAVDRTEILVKIIYPGKIRTLDPGCRSWKLVPLTSLHEQKEGVLTLIDTKGADAVFCGCTLGVSKGCNWPWNFIAHSMPNVGAPFALSAQSTPTTAFPE